MKSITSDWDKLAFNGAIKKGRKGSSFVSRSTGRDANGNRPSTLGKVRGLAFTEKCKLEKTTEIPIQKNKEGEFYYQARINGKFGRRLAISESLASKLGAA
jgi:hypothetical protein